MQDDAVKKKKRKTQSQLMPESCTSNQAAYSQPVHKHIVKQLAACEQLSDHIQVGSDPPGSI